MPDDEPEGPFCRAAYCVEPLGHAGRHGGLHYRLLDIAGVSNPAHASCECHPRPASRGWHCEAYGDALPEACFFDLVLHCASPAECAERMAGERVRVGERAAELAAAGDPFWSELVREYPDLGDLLGGRRIRTERADAAGDRPAGGPDARGQDPG